VPLHRAIVDPALPGPRLIDGKTGRAVAEFRAPALTGPARIIFIPNGRWYDRRSRTCLTGPMEHWAGWPAAPEAYLRGKRYLLGHELRHNYSQ
jgi:hypothetical protein